MGNDSPSGSRLPVKLASVKPGYKRPNRRNDLVPEKDYNKIDDIIKNEVKIGTNGVAYVPDTAFPKLFGVNKSAASYIYDNQIPDADKREDGSGSYAHSSAVVGLLDKKAQETRNADTQAKLQYSRDSLINVADSDQAQNIRRQCDTFTNRQLPGLKVARGGDIDELTGKPLEKNAAFHHVNPMNIHTSPEDALDPSKGRLLNRDSHNEVHRNRLNDEKMFEEYKENKNNKE